ncbi:MAG: class I SAM-dependent methyltransferase [Armatimonadetes bacterium]|nr:class I SAM-dependent methyltransferase [Armatimonadota bacterium]
MGDRVLRLVKPGAVASFRSFLGSEFASKAAAQGLLVTTQELGSGAEAIRQEPSLEGRADPEFQAFEHEKVWFPSYPYEWPAAMLYQAGLATLDVAEMALDSQYLLKDATPYNILFRGAKPVFIDLLSFDPRDPHNPIWLPYGQFERNFILPLMVRQKFGIGPDEFALKHRDGLEPEFVYKMLTPLGRWKPSVIGSVTLPAILAKKGQSSSEAPKREMANIDAANYVLRSALKGLRKKLERVRPAIGASMWTQYMQTFTYDDANFKKKEEFVKGALSEIAPKKVLDVGCNTGHFSFLAAGQGADVVAADYDPEVLGYVHQRAIKEFPSVLPLVSDLTRPTPATGWRNAEWPSFLSRATQAFDMVLMLAVIHHMHVSERVPMEEIVDLAADLTKDGLVIEYVGTQDPMFRALAKTKEHLFEGLTKEVFEKVLSRRFKILRSITLNDGHRELYFARRL